jgi:hypothetical protein
MTMQAICLSCHQAYEGEPDPLDHAMAAIWDEPLQIDDLCEACRDEKERADSNRAEIGVLAMARARALI